MLLEARKRSFPRSGDGDRPLCSASIPSRAPRRRHNVPTSDALRYGSPADSALCITALTSTPPSRSLRATSRDVAPFPSEHR